MNKFPVNELELEAAQLFDPLSDAVKGTIIQGLKRVANGEDMFEVFHELSPDVITDDVVADLRKRCLA